MDSLNVLFENIYKAIVYQPWNRMKTSLFCPNFDLHFIAWGVNLWSGVSNKTGIKKKAISIFERTFPNSFSNVDVCVCVSLSVRYTYI